MKKPLKVMSTVALASIFTATSLVPVAAAEDLQQAVDLQNFFLEKDGNYYEIDPVEYTDFKSAGVKFAALTLVNSSEGLFTKIGDYTDYKSATKTIDSAFEELKKADLMFEVEKTGKVVVNDETGEVTYVLDDQPEDRLNETFFYNFAA